MDSEPVANENKCSANFYKLSHGYYTEDEEDNSASDHKLKTCLQTDLKTKSKDSVVVIYCPAAPGRSEIKWLMNKLRYWFPDSKSEWIGLPKPWTQRLHLGTLKLDIVVSNSYIDFLNHVTSAYIYQFPIDSVSSHMNMLMKKLNLMTVMSPSRCSLNIFFSPSDYKVFQDFCQWLHASSTSTIFSVSEETLKIFSNELKDESQINVEETTALENGAFLETTQESCVVVETTQGICVGMETTQESCVDVETTQESCVDVETTQESCVDVETTQESCVDVETTQESCVDVETIDFGHENSPIVVN